MRAKIVGSAAVFASLLLALPASASTPRPSPMKSVSKAEWRADIDYFGREVVKRHANAFHDVKREAFESAVADLKARSEAANDDEMLVGLMRLTAMIGDGHTG